jgi:hypothetical protein
MPLLLIGTGLILMLTGVKGSPSALWTQLSADFTGPNNFIYWLVSILVLGALGYIKGLENLSRLFIVLLLAVIFLKSDTGFVAQLQTFINSSKTAGSTGGQANG